PPRITDWLDLEENASVEVTSADPLPDCVCFGRGKGLDRRLIQQNCCHDEPIGALHEGFPDSATRPLASSDAKNSPSPTPFRSTYSEQQYADKRVRRTKTNRRRPRDLQIGNFVS